MAEQKRGLKSAKRDYEFRLPGAEDDRCHDCIHVLHPGRSICGLLKIAIHDARRSRCPLQASTMDEMRLSY